MASVGRFAESRITLQEEEYDEALYLKEKWSTELHPQMTCCTHMDTVKRGKTAKEDNELAEELANSTLLRTTVY